jgi:hypothetical protein
LKRSRKVIELRPDVGLGEPPEYFAEDERARWKELEQLYGPSRMRKRFGPFAELLACSWAKYRRGELRTGRERAFLRSLFLKFGLRRADLPAEDQALWGAGRPR